MTDCLAEDDDEEPHPVSLTCFIVYSATQDTERRIYCSESGGLPCSYPGDPFPPTVTGNVEKTGLVVQNRSPFGLMGL